MAVSQMREPREGNQKVGPCGDYFLTTPRACLCRAPHLRTSRSVAFCGLWWTQTRLSLALVSLLPELPKMSSMSMAGCVTVCVTQVSFPLGSGCGWWVLWMGRPPTTSASLTPPSRLLLACLCGSSPPCPSHQAFSSHLSLVYKCTRTHMQCWPPITALLFDCCSPVSPVTVELLKDKYFALYIFIIFYLQTKEHDESLTNDCWMMYSLPP